MVHQFSSDEWSSSQDEEEASTLQSKRARRRKDPGRRIVSGRLYDSRLGVNCHFCRQKTIEDHALCSRCPIAFCGRCLRTRHGENIEVEKAQHSRWVCPKCRGGCGPGCSNCCACGPCRRLQNLAPPQIKLNVLKQAGFTNVHDYLIYLKTGESQDKLSARKMGRGWCMSVEIPSQKKEPAKQSSVGMAEIKKEEAKSFAQENKSCDGDDGSAHGNHKDVAGSNAERVYIPPRKSALAPHAAEFTNIHNHLNHVNPVVTPDKTSVRKVGTGCCTSVEIPVKHKETAKQNFVELAEIKKEETESFGEDDRLCDGDDECVYGKRSSVVCSDDERVNVAKKLFSAEAPSFLHMGEKFKRSLEAKLQEPFDSCELKRMWEVISCRKPILKARETRQGISCYPTKKDGYSYLDHHPELSTLLESTRQQEDRLKLLRGFFFWLEHAGTSGAFKPWLMHLQKKKTSEDCECIEIEGLDCEVLGMVCPVDEEKKENDFGPDAECQEDIKPKIPKAWILPSSCKSNAYVKEEPVD